MAEHARIPTRRGLSGALRATVLVAAGLAVAACSTPAPVIGDAPPGDRRSNPSASSPRPTAPPSVSFSARPGAAEGALAAYRGYLGATAVASTKPPKAGRPWPAGGDITRFAVDAVLEVETTLLHDMAARGQHFVGVPITPRPTATVTGTDRVEVRDCPVPSAGWRLVNADGSTAWSAPAGWAPQPNPIAATVVHRDGRWLVSALEVDTGRTCTP